MSRAADNHYPTLALAKITAFPVPAAKHSVLFLWATVAMKREALAIMAAWGFAYKTTYFWHKPGRGHGYWSATEQIEELLVGTRASRRPLQGTQPPQVQTFPRIGHSAKPPEFRAMIEALYPTAPRLEMFTRGSPAPGWDAIGDG